MRIRRRPRSVQSSICALLVGAALLSGKAAVAETRVFHFDIPAESTAAALNDLASQANIHLLFPFDAAKQTTALSVKGSYTVDGALALILGSSNLEIASETDTTITLRVASGKAEPATAEPVTEVVVTGTHLRGINPTSPVHIIDRKDIERSGYADIGDVVRSLPENFSGGQNPGVIFANGANTDNANLTNGSTVNLRGLGTDATLTLLNSHRMASDGYFQASDISGIPLSAVQRIEVVPDGASAVYGSDAVAGVANIILRKNYNGTELSARYGAATQGGGGEKSVSALTGTATDTHYLLVNLEIEHQDPVTAGQRDFTSAAPADTTLVQTQQRRSLFMAAGLSPNDRTDLSVDALISDRQANGQFDLGAIYLNDSYTPSYNLSVAMRQRLGGDWKLHVTGVAAGSRNSLMTSLPAYDYAATAHYTNSLSYVEATADGTLFALPGGDVKAAFGAGYRTEHYRTWVAGDSDLYEGDRTVGYLYGEALAPVVASDPSRSGLHELELSLSARSERYSDFGTTTNPRVGIRYVPFNDLTLRGTWGKSFKAPSFDKMYQPQYVALYQASVRGYAGAGTALYVGGGNPDLRPEKSHSWTLGADYAPVRHPGLRISATYFNIDYTDRVVNPINSFSTGLSDPIFAPFVDWTPAEAEQAGLVAGAAEFYNYSGGAYDPATVVAILHNNYTNAARQAAKGVDLAYSQSVDLHTGALNLFANATWLTLDQQTISTVPQVRLSGTIFNAPEFKARGGVTYSHGGLSASAIANYLSSETDTGVTPNVEIGSWTTLDANIAYKFQGAGLAGLRLALSVSNLFDRNPPYAVSSAIAYPGLAFDSTNASIMGRFVSLAVTKTW